MPKYIFVCGGVMSGVGKGIATASIAKILSWHGYKVTCLKIDPYVNVDAGTMNPLEHGEVFVLKDGTECDQDMGHYERFLNQELTKVNYMTTGSIYLSLIQKERSLFFDGKCVEVVPHVPLEVIGKINQAQKLTQAEIVITEIGGTVGEYQNLLFLEAVRILKLKNPKDVLLVLVSYLPYQGEGMELKTKPTQYSIRTLNSAGLQPDFVLARAQFPLDEKRKEKISFNCGVLKENIISAPDEHVVYKIPLNFEKEKLGIKILNNFGLKPKKAPPDSDYKKWKNQIENINQLKKQVNIGIVGKYFKTGDFVLADAYISVIEAIKHASWFLGYRPKIVWLNSEEYEKDKIKLEELKNYDGIIIPGGFGSRGIEGKILAIKYCRENKIPLFGLCYGLQLMIVEFARNVCGLKNAQTTEVNPRTKYPVIDILKEQKKLLEEKLYGGTMRLGDWECEIKRGTIAWRAYVELRRTDTELSRTDTELGRRYQKNISVSSALSQFVPRVLKVVERHRHRYEVNPKYHKILQKKGFVFSGTSQKDLLVEIGELPQNIHPFFLGTQFHPELKSRFLHPHPLFVEFIKQSIISKNEYL
ncbi:MAG: CTP synthetase [Candidatus Parcubacteria bacterium]|nr:MAG: CTP synthetase [Candidatus Parcubacteria bacterium]